MRLFELNACIGSVAIGLFTMSFDARAADAATYALNGYACRVTSNYDDGSIYVTFYTGPACTGSYIAFLNVRPPAQGAVEGYSESLLGPLVTAAANDTRITGTYTTYSSGPMYVFYLDDVTFNAN